MTDSPSQPPADPNADLASMSFTDLTIEYERLKEKGRKAASDDLRTVVQNLDNADLLRLTTIIQIKRSLSGGQPKESKASKASRTTKPAKPAAASVDDIMNIG